MECLGCLGWTQSTIPPQLTTVGSSHRHWSLIDIDNDSAFKKEFLINIEAGIGKVDKLTISGWDEGTKRSPRNHMFVDNSCQILGNLNKQTESDVRNELKKVTLSTGGAWTIA